MNGIHVLVTTLLLNLHVVGCLETCSKSPVFLKMDHYLVMNQACSTQQNDDANMIRFSDGGEIEGFSLNVLFTSELHGHFRHVPRLAALKKSLQSRGTPVLLLDCGDASFGSAFGRYYGYWGGNEILQLAGYDAVSLGNRDNLNDGVRTKNKSNIHSSLPIVSVNRENRFKNHVLSSTTINASGVMVGIVGVSPNNTAGSEAYLVKLIGEEASCLRTRHQVDIVILLSHGSTGGGMTRALRGLVDVVLGGHSEQRCGNESVWHVGPLPFTVSATYKARLVGDITIVGRRSMPAKASNFTSVRDDSAWEMALSSSPRDMSELPAVDKSLAISKLLLQRRHDMAVRSSAQSPTLVQFKGHTIPPDFDRNCRLESCLTGRLIATAVLAAFNCSGFVLIESKLIHESFHLAVTEESLRHTLPWNNSIVRLRIPSESLKAALGHSLRSQGSGEYLQLAYSEDGCPSTLSDFLTEVSTDAVTAMAALSASEEVDVMVPDCLAEGGGAQGDIRACGTLRGVEVSRSMLAARDLVNVFLRNMHTLNAQWPVDFTSNLVSAVPSDSTNEKLSNEQSKSMSETQLLFYEGIISLVSECIAIALSFPLLYPDGELSSSRKSKSKHVHNYSVYILIFSARVLSSALYWPLYYYALRVYTIPHGGKLFTVEAEHGFVASAISGSLITVVSNPLWVVVAVMQGLREPLPYNWRMCIELFSGLHYNLLLVLTPSLKMFFFEMLMVLSATSVKGRGVFASALFNGLCGCIASLLSTTLTQPLHQFRYKRHTNLYETAGYLDGGLHARLLPSAAYDFTSFFSFKIFFLLANILPYK